jgi:hypothetical protein
MITGKVSMHSLKRENLFIQDNRGRKSYDNNS